MDDGPSRNDFVSEVVTAIADVLKQHHFEMARALRLVQTTTEREILAANKALSRIYQEMRDHAQKLDAFKSDEANAEGESSFSAVLGKLAEALPALMTTLVKQAQAQAQLANLAEAEVAGVSTAATTITQVSLAARLLATNARIEAAHAGDQGAGFAVVADNLRQLSKEVDQSAKGIQDMGSTVREILLRMSRSAEQLGKEGQQKSAALNATVAECQQAYRNAVLASLDEFQARAAEIRDRANEALGHLQFQDRVQQAISSVAATSAQSVKRMYQLAKGVSQQAEEQSAEQVRVRLKALFADSSGLAKVEELAVAPSTSGEVQFL
jgi:methyl-accepting chemotaxis protein